MTFASYLPIVLRIYVVFSILATACGQPNGCECRLANGSSSCLAGFPIADNTTVTIMSMRRVGQWSFENIGNDGLVQDLSGNGHIGQVVGNVSWLFKTNAVYVQLDAMRSTFANFGTRAFVIELRLRVDPLEDNAYGDGIAIVRKMWLNSDGIENGWLLSVGAGSVNLFFRNGGREGKSFRSNDVVDGKWHNIRVERNATRVALFVDDTLPPFRPYDWDHDLPLFSDAPLVIGGPDPFITVPRHVSFEIADLSIFVGNDVSMGQLCKIQSNVTTTTLFAQQSVGCVSASAFCSPPIVDRCDCTAGDQLAR